MPTVLTGLLDTDAPLDNEQVVDMSEKVAMLQRGHEFNTMLNKLGTKPATREIVEWLITVLGPLYKPGCMLEHPSIRVVLCVNASHSHK